MFLKLSAGEMDHKSWLWKKKSSEKNVVGGESGRLSFSRNEEEVYFFWLLFITSIIVFFQLPALYVFALFYVIVMNLKHNGCISHVFSCFWSHRLLL